MDRNRSWMRIVDSWINHETDGDNTATNIIQPGDRDMKTVY